MNEEGTTNASVGISASVSSNSHCPTTSAAATSISAITHDLEPSTTAISLGELPISSLSNISHNEELATTTNSLIAEAERQAAIAAAVSIHSSSMSPSIAAGLAKVLVVPTNDSSNSSYSGQLSLQQQQGSSLRYLAAPTIVALPPLPPGKDCGDAENSATDRFKPVPLTRDGSTSVSGTIKPVRFDEVRLAFAELLNKERQAQSLIEQQQQQPPLQEERAGPTPDDCDRDSLGLNHDNAEASGISDEASDAASVVAKAPIQPAAGETENDGREEGPSDVVMTDIPSGADNSVKTGNVNDDCDNVDRVILLEMDLIEEENNKTIDDTSIDSTIESKISIESQQHTTTIPDSFLRFLLLLVRVPLVNEVKKDRPQSKASQEATTIAARRALEVFRIAQHSYDLLSEKQRCSRDRGQDATAAFFAACAGEKMRCSSKALPTSNSSLIEGGVNGDVSGIENISSEQNRTTIINGPSTPPKQKVSPIRFGNLLSSSAASSISSSSTAAAAVVSASAVFSNVMSKVSKKQSSFTEIGKIFMSGNAVSFAQGEAAPNSSPSTSIGDESFSPRSMEDYEVIIDQDMLGLTVENVLERTIIRTLVPDGAAKRANAKVGSLIAKVGNIDTSNLTHFETIDELRQSQRPLKLTLRHISSDILRCAREEMGRLIRGRDDVDSSKNEESNSNKPWKENQMKRYEQDYNKTLDSILRDRWPQKNHRLNTTATMAVLTRAEMIQRAGKDLIRILTLFIVGMEKELSTKGDSMKHLTEAIEITSKILLEYAQNFAEVNETKSDSHGVNKMSQETSPPFYLAPPGRIQGRVSGSISLPGAKGSKVSKSKKVTLDDSPLIRIGDALQRTTSFLVAPSSITASTLRWEVIDYLCVVLDLDSEQELIEKEAASSTEGGEPSPINDLGSAGSILKLIVLNSSSSVDSRSDSDEFADVESLSSLGVSTRSGNNSNSGNCFISVVHRLAASKSTSARISACSLGPVLWSHLDFPRQLQLRGVITRALHDVEVTVRKATATVLHEIAELVFDRRSVPWLVLMCERSMTDPEPQLRAAAMTLTWHLAEHLPNAFLGDASKGSRALRRLPPRTDPTFMDVYLLQCKLLPVASNLAEDKISSVRLSVAAQCDRLCNAMGEYWFNVIIDLLQALLSDADEIVRSEAVLCMPRLVESVIIGTSLGQNTTVLESLLPQAFKIQTDSSQLVRSALATAAGELLIFLVGAEDASNEAPTSPGRGAIISPSLYKTHVDDTLIPILQKLLQDSNPVVTTASLRAVTNASRSSARDTRTRISSTSHIFDSNDDDLASISSHQSLQSHASHDRRKPVFIPVLSEEQVLRILPTLSSLATSKEWRVRQNAVEIVPALLGCTYRHETRHEISKFCIKLMSDKVDAVRKTAAECLCLGGSTLARHGEDDGGEWITKIVIPHLKACSQSEDSKQRLLCLKMIEIIITNGLCPTPHLRTDSSIISLTSSFDSEGEVVETPMRMILEIAASHASDKVANIRLNVGRVFASIMLLLEKPDMDFIVEVLKKQLENESCSGQHDRDVIYFCQQAIAVSQSSRHPSLLID